MTRDEHNEIIEKLAAAIKPDNDDGSVAVLLAQLQDDYTEMTATVADSTATITDLTERTKS